MVYAIRNKYQENIYYFKRYANCINSSFDKNIDKWCVSLKLTVIYIRCSILYVTTKLYDYYWLEWEFGVVFKESLEDRLESWWFVRKYIEKKYQK